MKPRFFAHHFFMDRGVGCASGRESVVKHIFGYIENGMHDPELKYIGLARINTGIGLANLTYNHCHYVQLIRLGRLAATM
jgi:hypothetical protein